MQSPKPLVSTEKRVEYLDGTVSDMLLVHPSSVVQVTFTPFSMQLAQKHLKQLELKQQLETRGLQIICNICNDANCNQTVMEEDLLLHDLMHRTQQSFLAIGAVLLEEQDENTSSVTLPPRPTASKMPEDRLFHYWCLRHKQEFPLTYWAYHSKIFPNSRIKFPVHADEKLRNALLLGEELQVKRLAKPD